MATSLSFTEHKLLVANRGEIGVRILRTAKQLGLRTVAIYTQVDATAPHVILADESVALLPFVTASDESPAEPDLALDAKAYLDANAIVKICKDKGVTLVHPGYGFLSENAGFARLLATSGIILLGPDAQTIEDMGLKHRARDIAVQSGVPVVPGSRGLVESVEDAGKVAEKIGYPVMLKATAGGGGMGLVVCRNAEELRAKVDATQQRARSLFNNAGVFVEKFFDYSRHIEVQVFGNGCDHVIHMGERECSVQRRHQKIIEEAPSPFLLNRQDLREKMCSAAVRLAKLINYKSAGTVEFLVDDATGDFYFLEMNTRLQVEHAVTEMLHPGLDIVELMIRQGVYESSSTATRSGLPSSFLNQASFANPKQDTHAIEARVYCENPVNNFSPSPGILQRVVIPTHMAGVRVDTWVTTGMSITPFYDPLVAKVIVCGSTRFEAIEKMLLLFVSGPLSESSQFPQNKFIIQGPPNNISFLCNVFKEGIFRKGLATTEWVDRGGINYIPSAFTVLSPGINTTVQSLPSRRTGLGIPPSGPLDQLAFQAGNAIVGNPFECEGLELVVPPKSSGRSNGLFFSASFHVSAAITVTGAKATVRVDGRDVSAWARVIVPAGSKLVIGGSESDEDTSEGGLRAYLSILGGFPAIPEYLGSKSTSMGFGGYQGRTLQSGDMLEIIPANASLADSLPLPRSLIPCYRSEWTLYSLSGPHDDTEFLTASGIESFYARKWKVSSASNRMGIRLEPVFPEGADDQPVLDWARPNGGEGGSHPSNILDNGYARGSVNLNGDTPVILTNEGPSMGGYLCITTIASADQWKLGQIRPGDTLKFTRVSYSEAIKLREHIVAWLESVLALASGFSTPPLNLTEFLPTSEPVHDPKLHFLPAAPSKPKVVFRQAGDSAILIEYGEMTLDFAVRARIHGFETTLRERQAIGINELAPCIRSTMITFDNLQITQDEVLAMLIDIEEKLPDRLEEMEFPGRRLTFPIALDDKWNREALMRYMRSARGEAVYLPSNIEYLAKNNGIEGGVKEVLSLLVSSAWLVFGVGFYLACPFLVPIDPRCRLVGQKMNPSRTFTPRGAVGIAGLVAAIYPVESPGGYQLFGRTLPTWQAWGKGINFSPDKPWLLEPFDQVVFEPVSEDHYSQAEKEFDSGRYTFKVEPVTFSMKKYLAFVSSIQDEILTLKSRQAQSVPIEEARERVLLSRWQEKKKQESGSEALSEATQETSNFVSASLSGTIWQIKAVVGDIVVSSDQIVVILEAMKTEVNVMAGEENVGLVVAGFAGGIKEGKVVQAGEKLVFFTEN